MPEQTPAKKILCIEDVYFISELYSRSLEKAGYEVTIEEDGVKGLALAQSNQFDIILLDLMVPSITGMEILTTLRDPAKTPGFRAKIVITTNLEQSDAIRDAVEQQADGYIIKANVTPRELVAFLENVAV